VGECRCQAEEYGLRHGSANSDDECGHHCFRVTGLQPMKRPEQDGARYEQPGMGGALLEQIGEGRHLGSLHVCTHEIEQLLGSFLVEGTRMLFGVDQMMPDVVFDHLCH
jgi:hypothetical protein